MQHDPPCALELQNRISKQRARRDGGGLRQVAKLVRLVRPRHRSEKQPGGVTGAQASGVVHELIAWSMSGSLLVREQQVDGLRRMGEARVVEHAIKVAADAAVMRHLDHREVAEMVDHLRMVEPHAVGPHGEAVKAGIARDEHALLLVIEADDVAQLVAVGEILQPLVGMELGHREGADRQEIPSLGDQPLGRSQQCEPRSRPSDRPAVEPTARPVEAEFDRLAVLAPDLPPPDLGTRSQRLDETDQRARVDRVRAHRVADRCHRHFEERRVQGASRREPHPLHRPHVTTR